MPKRRPNYHAHQLYLGMVSLEYQAVRDDINGAYSQIFISMQIAMAFIGILLGICFNQGTEEVYRLIILCILIPIVSLAALSHIVAEAVRMERAGGFLCIIEAKVKHIFAGYVNKRFPEWGKMQLKMEEKYLNITAEKRGAEINISDPLSYERWIRHLASSKSIYARSAGMIKFRYLFFFIVPFLSMIYAYISQLITDGYTIHSNIAVHIFIEHNANYIIQFIGSAIAVVWYIVILCYGSKLAKSKF